MKTTTAKKHGPNVWVIRNGNGFSIRMERNVRLLIPSTVQRTAVAIARQIARANNSELLVQGKTARIRFRDSHGNDPFPPKG